jgi:outer membrane protein TolC
MRHESKVRLSMAALFVALALPVGAATGAEPSLTLNEAIRLALQKSDALLIERESLEAATSAVSGAHGAYDPQLDVDGSWSQSRQPANSSFSGAPLGQLAPEVKSTGAGVQLHQLLPTGGALSLRARGDRETTDGIYATLSPAYQTQVGVELRQPLLRDLSIDSARLSVRVARAGRRGAAASLRQSQMETVAAVEQVYWSLVAARLDVGVREEAVRLAQEQLTETQARAESGASPETELAQPRAELERRRGELLAAQETVARTENRLKLLVLGDDDALWASRITPADSAAADVVPVDVEASVQKALSSRPELDAAQSVVEQRRAETSFARNGVWPRLDAVVSYDRFGLAGSRNPAGPDADIPAELNGTLGDSFQTLGDGDFHETRVALVLGLPIGNRTARSAAEVARRGERQAEADLTRVRKAIRAEVLDAAAAIETTSQRIEAARSAREAAEVQLSSEKDRFATGLSTNFLVLTRQNDLSRARLDEISALTDYRLARSEMARATGSLLEERGIPSEGKEH